jgi:hypothetical protein
MGCCSDGLSGNLLLTSLKALRGSSNVLTTKPLLAAFQRDILPEIIYHFKNRSYSLHKIFTASEYGFLAKRFHEITHGVKNTVLFVRTVEGRVLGGFTPCTWLNDVLYKYEDDAEYASFLFVIKP